MTLLDSSLQSKVWFKAQERDSHVLLKCLFKSGRRESQHLKHVGMLLLLSHRSRVRLCANP